jgi:hypothetical protein
MLWSRGECGFLAVEEANENAVSVSESQAWGYVMCVAVMRDGGQAN